MLKGGKTREAFILVYVNEGPPREDKDCCARTVIRTQHLLLTSRDSHIVIAFRNDPKWHGDMSVAESAARKKEHLVCYEVVLKGKVRRVTKTLINYSKKFVLWISEREYRRTRRFLDKRIGTPFNTGALFWNFMPLLRYIPIRGTGYYCAQLIAEALAYANVINLDSTVPTRGYPTRFCCCIPLGCSSKHKAIRRIKIPKSYQITVGMLIDIIQTQCQTTFALLPSRGNANEYAVDVDDDDGYVGCGDVVCDTGEYTGCDDDGPAAASASIPVGGSRTPSPSAVRTSRHRRHHRHHHHHHRSPSSPRGSKKVPRGRKRRRRKKRALSPVRYCDDVEGMSPIASKGDVLVAVRSLCHGCLN